MKTTTKPKLTLDKTTLKNLSLVVKSGVKAGSAGGPSHVAVKP